MQARARQGSAGSAPRHLQGQLLQEGARAGAGARHEAGPLKVSVSRTGQVCEGSVRAGK